MNRHVESFAKYAGLATVAVEWSALLIYYLQMPLYFGWKYPISFFATLPETRWAFSACYTLAAICFWIFTKHHLAKYFTVPLKIFAASLILFAATGLLPYNPDDAVSVVVHVAVALSSGLLFLAGMFMLARRSQDRLVRTVTYVAILLSFALTVLFMLSPKESHLIFTFEAGSWLMLQLWTIWISFYVHKKHRAK